MTDDEIQQAVDRTLASIKAASESYIGAPVARERVEAASSKAMGFPVRFPDWDEASATATKMVIVPPFTANYTPRTVYACGLSDYDQRPGTFLQKCGGGEE